MDELIVRVFNVKFGDATLVTIPDAGVERHILFDFGNALGEGGPNEVFDAVHQEIRRVIGSGAIDLYVMSHEHMDHIQGPLYIESTTGQKLPVRDVWMPASAEGAAYYDRFPDAKRKRLDAVAMFGVLRRIARRVARGDERIETLLFNNGAFLNLGLSSGRTADCVEAIRGLGQVRYMFRTDDVSADHGFQETAIEVWAPDENTSVYYGRFRPLALTGLSGGGGGGGSGGSGVAAVVAPPPGVDAGAYVDLVDRRRSGWVDSLLAIDRAANNTSLVVALEWRGWRLLFPGDAELRSWQEMERRAGLLKPVHFLKVSHHGSHNGTPPDDLLDRVLPTPPPDARPRFATISTCADVYSGVPHTPTTTRLTTRCTVHSTESIAPGVALEFRFRPDGTAVGPATPPP